MVSVLGINLRNVNCFAIHKLSDAMAGEFTPKPAFFDSAKGEAGIGAHERIDEAAACI